MTMERLVSLTVNGRRHDVRVPGHRTLLETLRDLGHVDVKCGCEKGDCGACAVLLDGQAVDSCLMLAWQADRRAVTTVRGLGAAGEDHPLHRAFIETGAVQCGYCIPG
ncbi:MAG: 2Fe-2S iron-sulfur cluster-binding protein, partial [Alphaproteobacteria bacterium]